MTGRVVPALLCACAVGCGGGQQPRPRGVVVLGGTGIAANGTTLPFQRHATWLSGARGTVLVAALQQQGEGGRGLTLFRSADVGKTWAEALPIQPDFHRRDV